jgi:hypothetical protein
MLLNYSFYDFFNKFHRINDLQVTVEAQQDRGIPYTWSLTGNRFISTALLRS